MKLRPLLQAGAQSGTIMAVSDIGTQVWEKSSSSPSTTTSWKLNELDAARTVRWTVAGVILHGPYFATGFSLLDRQFGVATPLRTVVTKTAAAQFLLFPPYLIALFGLLGVLEGLPPTQVMDKIRHRVPEVFVHGCAFWPVANVVNFALVSPTLRVPYVAACAGVWNSYLSWTNARDDAEGDSVGKAIQQDKKDNIMA